MQSIAKTMADIPFLACKLGNYLGHLLIELKIIFHSGKRTECRCGSTYGKYNISKYDSDCSMTCAGWPASSASRQYCGRYLRNSVFKIVYGECI